MISLPKVVFSRIVRMNRKALICVLIFALPLQVFAASSAIERVEPPFWWTGFKQTELQVLVYGKDISRYTPSIEHEGVTIERVETVESPNYLSCTWISRRRQRPANSRSRFRAEAGT